MDIIDIYIPSHVVNSAQNLKEFYDYYETLVTSQQFKSTKDIKIKDKLIAKALELKEPDLKKFIEEKF